jgi:hypothetical protein
MSRSSKPARVVASLPDLRRSRFTGPLHIQIGNEALTILPGGLVEVTPALAAALGEELLASFEPVTPGPTEQPSGGPTEEA